VEILPHRLSADQLDDFRTPNPGVARSLDDGGARAILQFAVSADGQLWYRTFHRVQNQALELDAAGRLVPGGEKQSIWQSMHWKLQILEFLPNSQIGPVITAVERDLGTEDPVHPPAIHCILRRGAAKQDFWVPQQERNVTAVTVGGEQFAVNYAPARHPLGFAMTLARGEQTTDPGSSLPATQSSFILLTDPASQLMNTGRLITMNEPLVHGGFKIFQSGYQSLSRDPHGRQISRCSLTVTRDPGVRLKYAGATMVALGIACMFYMRAYFFGRPGPNR
jgi:hypothetical protein